MPAVQMRDQTNSANSFSHTPKFQSSAEFSYSVPLQEEPDIKKKYEKKEEKKEEKANKKDKNNEEKEEMIEWVDVLGSGQLKMKVTKKGQPETRPQPPDICEIKLKGTLEDGTVVEEYELLQIQLGCYEVVQGVELAIPLMDIGEEAVIIVAPRFAYGPLGNPPIVPPNATLTYEITLVRSIPEVDVEKIPFELRKNLANDKRERGNWWYLRQDAIKAMQCYRKALDLLDETIPYCDENERRVEYSEDEMREVIKLKLIMYNNLAAAQMMVEAYESALMSVNRVLHCDPKNIKALFRKGKILYAKGSANEAVESLKQANALEPDNSAIKMELSRCVKVLQTEKQHEKNLYKKMLGQDKKDDKSSGASEGTSIWSKIYSTVSSAEVWTKVLGTVAFATAAIVVGVSSFSNSLDGRRDLPRCC